MTVPPDLHVLCVCVCVWVGVCGCVYSIITVHSSI